MASLLALPYNLPARSGLNVRDSVPQPYLVQVRAQWVLWVTRFATPEELPSYIPVKELPLRQMVVHLQLLLWGRQILNGVDDKVFDRQLEESELAQPDHSQVVKDARPDPL